MLPCGLAGEMPEPIVPPACRITSPSGVDLWVGGPRLVGALVGALWLGSPVPEGTDPVGPGGAGAVVRGEEGEVPVGAEGDVVCVRT